MTHLRRHLEETGTLASEQLDAALRRQQIYGGSLDSVLLELEILDALSLNELLQQACGLDIVPVDLIEDGTHRPDGVLPDELVSIGWAVPLAVIDDRLHVAVHPDLPNERLGALYRQVPGVVPMVTPECALEKMAAELTRSVVPQRYAILCASYISALKRRPSVSDAGIPLIADARTEDTQRAQIPTDPSAPATREDLRRTQFYKRADIDQAIAATKLDAPDTPEARASAPTVPTSTGDTQITRKPQPPALEGEPAASGRPAPPVVSPPAIQAPPVRFKPPTAGPEQGESAGPSAPSATTTSPAVPVVGSTAMSSTLDAIGMAQSRDAVIEGLIRGAMTISARVGLFRIKGKTLQGISTPRSALPDLSSKVVSITPGSDIEKAVEVRRWVGTTADPSLREAIGVGAIVPCMTMRIDVAGRPALLMYLDHQGRSIGSTDAEHHDTLIAAVSDSFERIIKAKRSAVKPTAASAPEASPPASSTPTPMPHIPALAGPAASDRDLAPPPSYGTTEPARWGPAPAEVEEEPRSSGAIADELDDVARPRRLTQIDGSGSARINLSQPEERITVRVTPPVDPGPDEGAPQPQRPAADSGPMFSPPEVEATDEEIISLSAPIGQPSARGKIELDDEDIADTPPPEPDEDRTEEIDAAIEAVARRGEAQEQLSAFGEAALVRLAALFPGPLEVLRRDLRALPPPSAHGPYIRLAIRLGQAIVPYIVELFPHPDPDVRFYAAFLFQELRDERCMAGLAKLAFDGSGDVRVISMRVLETYSRMAGFNEAVGAVREELESSTKTRQLYAARAVGTLRDVGAIPELIELLANKDRFIQEAALESLCSITGQQHGLKPHRWRSWYADHGSEHRIEWIIGSLRHRDLPVRRWAHDELIRVTGHRIPFSPLGDKKAREVAVASWTDWWVQTGRARFTSAAGYAG